MDFHVVSHFCSCRVHVTDCHSEKSARVQIQACSFDLSRHSPEFALSHAIRLRSNWIGRDPIFETTTSIPDDSKAAEAISYVSG